MGKNQNPQFAMIPFKLWKLGLDPYEFALFATLRMHGDKDGREIFPSLALLVRETGMSRGKIWKSLRTLKDCRVIEWQGGHTGVANEYSIRPVGHWIPKSSSPGELPDQFTTRTRVVHHVNGSSSPGEPQLDPGTRSMNYSAHAVEDETSTPEVAAKYRAMIRNSLGIEIPERSE